MSRTWIIKQTTAPNSNWYSVTSSSDGTKLAACVNGGGIWYSLDSGDSWTISDAQNLNWSGITSSADGTKLAAFVYEGGIWYSSDSGNSWRKSNALDYLTWSSITSSGDGTKLAACIYSPNNSIGGIWLSTTSGEFWSETFIPYGYYYFNIWYSITSSYDGKNLAVSSYNSPDPNIFTSIDYGANWTRKATVGTRGGSNSITSDSSGTKLAACVDAEGIYISNDSGDNWIKKTGLALAWQSIKSDSTGEMLAACVNGGEIWFSPDRGNTWSTVFTSSLNWISLSLSSNGNKLVACVPNEGIYTFVYTNSRWKTFKTSLPNSYEYGAISYSSNGNNLITYVNGNNSRGIYKSTDSGSNWTSINQPDMYDKYCYSITSSSDGTILAAAVATPYYNKGGIWVSTDSGVTWLRNSTIDTVSITSSSNGQKLAACIQAGYIYVSTDSGKTWSERRGSPINTYSIASSSNGEILAATNGPQVWKSNDGGSNWYQTSAPIETYYSIALSSDGNIIALTGVNVVMVYDGTSWKKRASFISKGNSITSSADGQKLTVSDDRNDLTCAIYTSTDNGLSWFEIYSIPYGIPYSVTSTSNGLKLAACGAAFGVLTFEYIPAPITNYTVEINNQKIDLNQIFQPLTTSKYQTKTNYNITDNNIETDLNEIFQAYNNVSTPAVVTNYNITYDNGNEKDLNQIFQPI